MLKTKYLIFLLFASLILYQVIGVTIHDQYGFGLFYWPIKEGMLLILSLLFILTNLDKVKYLYSSKFFLYQLYIFIMILFQFTYLLFIEIENYDKDEIFFDLIHTVNYYLISIALILNFKKLTLSIRLKYILLIYTLIVVLFFMFTFNVTKSISTTFILGPTFHPSLMDDLPGYTWGFHLFFSPYFSIYSLFLMSILKENRQNLLFFIVSVVSIYLLFLAGGRGSFLVFIIVLAFFFLSKKALALVLLITFISSSFLLSIAEYFSENSRMYDLLIGNVNNDGSVLGRLELLSTNLSIIGDNFFLGSYHSYTDSNYIHNILSIMQDYGVVGFVVILLIIFHGSYIYLFKNKENDRALLIAGSVFFLSVFDAILAKYSSSLESILLLLVSYGYMILALNTKYFINNRSNYEKRN